MTTRSVLSNLTALFENIAHPKGALLKSSHTGYAPHTMRSLSVATVAMFLVASQQLASAQELHIEPAQGLGVYPGPFQQACLNPDQWPTVLANTTYFGSAAWQLDQAFTDADQTACFASINSVGLKFETAVNALDASCTTGQQCFTKQIHQLTRMTMNGANIVAIEINEPLTFVLHDPTWPGPRDFSYAVNETANFISLVRQNYPSVKIIEQEAYPATPSITLAFWVQQLQAQCAAIGTTGPDYFDLDHDWNRSDWSWSDISTLMASVRSNGVKFGIIIWAARHSTSTNDPDWYNDVWAYGWSLPAMSIYPDLYSVLDWLNIPAVTIPETTMPTFMKSVYDLINGGVLP